MSTGAPPTSSDDAPTAPTALAPSAPSGESSPFAMLGDPTAAACEGDACLIP